MNTNDGKWLEHLVKTIESFLTPHGFKIETRERVYNDAGVQIAEFDIVIMGELDSKPAKWLIECRDRPSEGPAPGNWIEQLVGRRQIYGFDKVMAVSTTGFSQGAKDLSEQTEIEIRVMDSLTFEAVMSWLSLRAPVVIRQGKFSNIQIYLSNATKQDLDDLNSKAAFNVKTPIVVGTNTDETISIVELWHRTLKKNPQLFNGLTPNGEPKHLLVQAVYKDEQYQIEVEGCLFSIAQIDFSANLSIKIPQMPLTQIYQYSEAGGEIIAKVAKWEGQPSDAIRELAFIGFPKKD